MGKLLGTIKQQHELSDDYFFSLFNHSLTVMCPIPIGPEKVKHHVNRDWIHSLPAWLTSTYRLR
jgi:hypothetical protein